MLRLVHTLAQEERRRSLDDQALGWVVRLTSGETNGADIEEFRTWRDQSPEHAQALARARTLWAQTGSALPGAERRAGSRPAKRLATRLSIAASLALTIWVGNSYLVDWRHDYATSAGEQRIVILKDGSHMTLAGDSAADIHFENGVRAIRLARGEALFNVTHDRNQPFVVYAGHYAFRDLGTAFDVRRREDGTDVTVTEGLVEASDGEKRTVLAIGQAMSFHAEVEPQVRTVDPSAATAWARGHLIMEDRPLRDIIAALKPHYNKRIVLLNSAAANRRLSVVIDLQGVDEWLDGLAEAKEVRVTKLGGVVLLT